MSTIPTVGNLRGGSFWFLPEPIGGQTVKSPPSPLISMNACCLCRHHRYPCHLCHSATLAPSSLPTQPYHAAGVHKTTTTVTRRHGLDNSTCHQGDRQSGEHAGIIFVWSTCHCYDHLGREHSNSYEPAGKATLLSYCTSPGAGTTSQRASMAYFVGAKNYFPPRKNPTGST